MTQYFSIKNWDEFQHYKDRNPPWIKLHNQLLDNYQFECLTDATKGHLLCIWMLASRTNNKIVYDPSWVKRKIGANSHIDLEALLSSGFIELQGLVQDASMGLDSEEERQRRGKKSRSNIPYDEIRALYNQILPELKGANVLDKKRKSTLKETWDLHRAHQTIEFWEKYFKAVRNDDHAMGRTVKKPPYENWVADFGYIVKTKTVLKITESAQ